MRISLTVGQNKILANFFLDFAKGLALATVLGQGFIAELTGLERVFSFITLLLMALISLLIALYFERRVK